MASEPDLGGDENAIGDYTFRRVGDVCATPQEDVLACEPPAGNAQHVAASSAYGLVFFADARGARSLRAAAALLARTRRVRLR
jgi:hypothetical protein